MGTGVRSVLLAVVVIVGGPVGTAAHVTTQAVEYRDGETVLEGYLAYDEHMEGKQPGVLVVHEWKGLNDYAKGRAEQLAGLGYVAFAVDMYGKGVYAKDHTEAGQLSGAFRNDRQLMRRRIQAALDVLKQRPMVDPQRIAAIGFCFGGTTVLELARSGAPVIGVISVHGALNTPNPQDAQNITGRVLVLHGTADTFVSQDEVAAFEQEMEQARVDYDVIQYDGAVHSFTVPEAGNDPSKGTAYHPEAAAQAWEEIERFLGELFGAQAVGME